jgi:iron complex transport system permease protein
MIASLQVGSDISLLQQIKLIPSLFNIGVPIEDFASIIFIEGRLPRFVMALCVGASLGLAGSLLQQLTQNALVSPLTLGSASGAWLALVICSIWFPALVSDFDTLFALVGAMLTLMLVVFIAGIRNLSGLPVILAGMAVNILLGSVATAIVLLNEQFAKNLFIWGAGDLAQNGWQEVRWLVHIFLPAILFFIFAHRILSLLRLGLSYAIARGLNFIPLFFGLIVLALWLVSASISTVGVISFVGLLAPNIARHMNARTPLAELLLSTALGAVMLVFTDTLAIWLSTMTLDIVPSGIAAALIGAPALIYLSRKKLSAQDNISLVLPCNRLSLSFELRVTLVIIFVLALVLALFVSKGTDLAGITMWQIKVPSSFAWELRWPRILTAIAAGAGVGVSGVLLQRLIYNPLASPDILGISSGATLALVAGSIFFGINIFEAAPLMAFLGCMLVLVILIWLGKKHNYAPSMLILIGISLTALIEALVQFSLAKGDESVYGILNWLAGSTYRVSPQSAVILGVSIAVLLSIVYSLQRWVTIISAGRSFAHSRGLQVSKVFILLLTLVALISGIVTSFMGPVAFVGLLAPHIAVMLGAKKANQQIAVTALIGSTLMLLADWVGQVIVYPSQIAAGTIVSIIGGIYFILLLIKGRKLA